MAEAVSLPRVSAPEQPAPGPIGRVWGFFTTLARRKPLGFASFLFLIFMGTVGIMPGLFATHDPADTNAGPPFQPRCLGPSDTFLCPTNEKEDFVTGQTTSVGGSLNEPFGTDQLGRDLYSRVVYGARWAMYIGIVSVTISSVLSLLIGVSSGYIGGAFDSVLQRFVDAFMAIPVLVLLIALPTLIGSSDLDGPLPFDEGRITFFKLAVLLGIIGAAGGSRVIRSAVIGVRSSQYLEAARVVGATDARIMIRHVIPNIFGALMVQATIALGSVILVEATLSFLGFGVTDPDKPTWGQMLDLSRRFASVEPWGILWPGAAIALAVFSFNMLGDALRDLLDPRLRGVQGRMG
ncbi:MAG TPA: ABC transporter permease [Tepidiformaceae bacterium]|nr:ABC transporter permease [Tepidiformaceae bacterium]